MIRTLLSLTLLTAGAVTGCAPHGWHKYMAQDGTDTGVEAAYLDCRDTGPYANTIRLAYAFEYETSQCDCMKARGFQLRR